MAQSAPIPTPEPRRPAALSRQGSRAGLAAFLLVLLVLGLQYLGSYYAVQLARISKEDDLKNHMEDLGALACEMLRAPALTLDDLGLESLWEAQVRREEGQTPASAAAVYRASLTDDVTQPVRDFASRSRMRQVLVLSPEGRVLFDSLGREPLLAPYAFWEVDRRETGEALAGRMASTLAYEAGTQDAYYKRAYVPVTEVALTSGTATLAGGRRVGAVLCLVAGRRYLDELGGLTTHLSWASGLLTALMALIAVLIWRLMARQRRVERQASENDRLAALGRLAAGFAHELRNPLGIIRAFTEDLQHELVRGGGGPEALEACDDIIEEVDRMNRLVGQFLGYSRGRPPEPGNGHAGVLETVESVLAIVRPSAEKQGVTLRIEHAPATRAEATRWQARLEPGALRQVLMNLLLNATQISPRGGVVRIGLETQARRVRLSVADQGPGVARGDQSRIFEPFYTTREGGSGLGLAISRQIATAGGGTLELGADPPGGGACFVLTLPRAADAAPGEKRERTGPPAGVAGDAALVRKG